MSIKTYLNEDDFFDINQDILAILLMDRTTKKNIIWGTNNYIKKGYHEKNQIFPNNVIGRYNPIKPRIDKSKKEQAKRSKDMAEVFTASWICNNQNNLVDEQWFGYKNSFNVQNGCCWIPTEKVLFVNNTWQQYVKDIRLEITCGEGPYLVSRYDAVSGKKMELKSRIGFFDRKMRVIMENAIDDNEWLEYSLWALKSVYGYEYQGDNLLIARRNLFFSYIDYYVDKFNLMPSIELLKNVAEIISWNIWQMDGLKLVVPLSCHEEAIVQLSLFDDVPTTGEFCRGCKNDDITKHNGKRCMIMDWEKNKPIKFISLLKGVYTW